jgi:hypothetical protein
VFAVVFAESSYEPDAVSPQGAMGLMQLMPETARQYGATDPLDPAQNVEAGVRFLRELLDRFERNVELAVAAYNAGAYAVVRAGYRIPDNPETRTFVPRVMGYYRDYRSFARPARAPAHRLLQAASPRYGLPLLLAAIPLAGAPDKDPPRPRHDDPKAGIVPGRRARRWRFARILGSGAASSIPPVPERRRAQRGGDTRRPSASSLPGYSTTSSPSDSPSSTSTSRAPRNPASTARRRARPPSTR